jgi:zinc protease
MITTGTKTETTVDAIKLMLSITEETKAEGVTEEELAQAKSSWLASFPSYYQEPEQVLLDRMRYAKHDFPLDFWDKLPDKIEPLEVSDVNAFAARFLEPEKLIILVLGDSTSFDGSLSELGDITVIDPEEY